MRLSKIAGALAGATIVYLIVLAVVLVAVGVLWVSLRLGGATPDVAAIIGRALLGGGNLAASLVGAAFLFDVWRGKQPL